jgi:hypothetical protein
MRLKPYLLIGVYACLLVVGFSVTACCRSNSWRQELASKKVLQAALTSTTETVNSVAKIPPYVLNELGKIAGEQPFRMAEPNQEFNATDIKVSDYNRRLIFAAKSQNYFIVCYDITSSEPCAVIFAIDPVSNSAEPLMVAKVEPECRTLEQLRQAYMRGNIVQFRPTFIDF